MKERVKTVEFQEQLPTQGSYPSKFTCDDGKIYIVKHSENGRLRRELINEWLGNAIAALCGVAVPRDCVVEIMPDSIGENQIFQRMRPSGICFGSEQLSMSKNINDILFSERDFRKFAIPEQLLRIIILDVWLHNNDRTINNPNLLVSQERSILKLYAIDHARIFNGFSYSDLLRSDIISECPTLYDTLIPYPLTQKAKQKLALFFEPTLNAMVQKIASIPPNSIANTFSVLPPEYSLNNEEQDILLQYLTTRQKYLGDFLTELVREEL